jgi:tetratricopeptide (TPR) repeat protein
MEHFLSNCAPRPVGFGGRASAGLDELIDFIAVQRVETADRPGAEACLKCAMARHARGDQVGALADCERALVQNPGHAAAHNLRGSLRRELGDLPGAVADYDEALRLNPDLAAAYNNRGVARHELGDAARALADFDEAVRRQPAQADAYGNRAAVRAELGDFGGADEDCRRAAALAPASATVHGRRGALLQQQKKWSAALGEYDRALELNPGLYWAYVLRGHTRYHLGDWRGLCADYDRAFALQPDRAAGLVVRTLLAGLKPDAAAALRACDEHVRQDAEDPISYARRGLALLLLRRTEEAGEDFQRCRALWPDAAQILEQIIMRARAPREGATAPN